MYVYILLSVPEHWKIEIPIDETKMLLLEVIWYAVRWKIHFGLIKIRYICSIIKDMPKTLDSSNKISKGDKSALAEAVAVLTVCSISALGR